MSFSDYKGYRLRNRVFIGFLTICILSVVTSAALSFVILRDNAKKQSKTDMQNKSQALMASLDYALSHSQVQTYDIPKVLDNEIYEIADVNKHDIIIYDLKGNPIPVPRYLQRFLRDIWRWKFLSNYKIVWFDWFKVNPLFPIQELISDENYEYSLEGMFRIADF